MKGFDFTDCVIRKKVYGPASVITAIPDHTDFRLAKSVHLLYTVQYMKLHFIDVPV